MSSTFENRYLVILGLVVAGVGTVDAAASREWDLLVVLGMLDTILLTLGARTAGRRPPVRLRGDLVAWLRARASAVGEPLEVLADRAVAAYQHRLDPERSGPGSSG